MEDIFRKYRDRIRILLILYTFCERIGDNSDGVFGVFRTEIKIQALDFLLRYPDFLSMELMDLMESNSQIMREEVKSIIYGIYQDREPEIRSEEMGKFFHGAYESIDDVIAFLVSVGLIRYDSKKRIDGKEYDKMYYVTHNCALKIESELINSHAIKWYSDRCELIRKFFGEFSGSELKTRQYRYAQYKDVSYKSHIQNINNEVKNTFAKKFNKQLA